MTRPSTYRANLPPAEDTTAAGDRPRITPGFLRYVGEMLHGPRWQTPLAQRLGEFRGKNLAPATINQWCSGARSIPGWVGPALVSALEAARAEFEGRAQLAAATARRLEQGLPEAAPLPAPPSAAADLQIRNG